MPDLTSSEYAKDGCCARDRRPLIAISRSASESMNLWHLVRRHRRNDDSLGAYFVGSSGYFERWSVFLFTARSNLSNMRRTEVTDNSSG